VAVLLGVLATSPGLGPTAVLAGGVVALLTWAFVERGLRREGLTRLGVANVVTLCRAVLTAGVTALVVQSWSDPVPRALVVAIAAMALATDLVDGRLARRTGSVTRFGAAFDMEVDAFLILVLSVYAVPLVGPAALLIGLARYLLVLAGVVWPWLTAPTPTRPWAKLVAAVQGVVLTMVVADVLPRDVARVATLVALALLVESFAHQIVALWRLRREHQVDRSPLVRPVVDALAIVLVWGALMLPHRPDELSGSPSSCWRSSRWRSCCRLSGAASSAWPPASR
jgi:phosphatidylglycerophosphate synthase